MGSFVEEPDHVFDIGTMSARWCVSEAAVNDANFLSFGNHPSPCRHHRRRRRNVDRHPSLRVRVSAIDVGDVFGCCGYGYGRREKQRPFIGGLQRLHQSILSCDELVHVVVDDEVVVRVPVPFPFLVRSFPNSFPN